MMTESAKIDTVKAFVETDPAATDAVVTVYLNKAKAAILRRLYPWGNYPDYTEIPVKYEMLQCELASRYFLKRGAEGEYIHDENGVNRHYNSANDEDLLSEVVPYAFIPNGGA